MQKPGTQFFIDPNDLPDPGETPSVGNGPQVIARPDGVKTQVPEGFKAELFADGLGQSRWLEAAPNCDLLLTRPGSGDITVLRDADGNGTAETVRVLISGLNKPHATEIRPDGLYVVDVDRVWRVDYEPGDLIASSPPEPITEVGEFPSGGGHNRHSLAFSADGSKFYVGIGSQGNVAVEPEPRATILEFNADGSGGQVYASGLRNPSALEVHPETGELFVAVVERDGLGEELVPDYLTHVEAGGFYGWPYAYIGANPQPGFAGQRPDLVEASLTPDLLFQSHSTPIGFVFYDGEQFPADYSGDAFVALRGSWNAAEPRGYMVAHVPFEDGRPEGDYFAFATGFWHSGTAKAEVWGRPTGLAVGSDGSLYIADDTGGTVWRISRVLAGDDVIDGTGDADRLDGESGGDLLRGLGGDDFLLGGDGKDTLLGQAGDDDLWGQKRNDLIEGGDGDDELRGNWGQDTLDGGAGHDTLIGGQQDDVLVGGAGNDVFVLVGVHGDDTIRDFENGGDRIDLSAYGVSEVGDFTISRAGDDAVISDYGGDDRIVLEGFDAGNLGNDDFVFG